MAVLAIVRTAAHGKLSCAAAANAPATVFYKRYVTILDKIDSKDSFLAVRAYSSHIEAGVVVRFLEEGHGNEVWMNDPSYRDRNTSRTLDTTQWSQYGSLASCVLFILGRISTVACGTRILAQVRESKPVKAIMAETRSRLEPDICGASPRDTSSLGSDQEQDPFEIELQTDSLISMVRLLMRQILWRCSAVFATTHCALDKVIKPLTKSANEYFLDEAGAAILAEALQLWRMDKRLVLMGDAKQLLPATLSAGEKHPVEDGHIVNPLARQHMSSLLNKLMLTGSPLFTLQFQRGMCPGLFDLSSELFYARLGMQEGSSIGQQTLGMRCHQLAGTNW